MTEGERRFGHGVLTGIAASAVLVQLWLAVELDAMAGMYADMGKVELPLLTRLVISPAWRWTVPAVAVGLVIVLAAKRPRIWAPYAILAVATVAAAIATWHFAQAPIYELAGNIQAD